ncbi:hypothetical protein GCM10027596_40070 [Nocardioides korecus]
MQRERRRDPYPWTWEIPLGIGIGVLLLITAGAQLGRSLANLVAGAGWTWPAIDTHSTTGPFPSPVGSAFWSSLPGVFAGHAGAGLSPSLPASDLAAPPMLWGCLLLTELLLLAWCGWVSAWGYQRWGPGRMKGMATAAEAETLLGITRLRKVTAHVRPDLHGRTTAMSSRRVARTAAAGHDTHADGAVGHGRSPWSLPGRRSSSRRIRE